MVAKPLNRNEAKGDLVMIQTLLLFKCKLLCYHANWILVSITTRSPSASLQIKGLATKYTTVKWPIVFLILMTLMFDLGMLLLGEIRYVFVNINNSSPTASLGMLKWAKNEENLALQDVFSKVFEVSTMWTTVMKDFTEEVFIIFVLLNLYYFLNKNISNYCVAL